MVPIALRSRNTSFKVHPKIHRFDFSVTQRIMTFLRDF
jgi:hypothetical protein